MDSPTEKQKINSKMIDLSLIMLMKTLNISGLNNKSKPGFIRLDKKVRPIIHNNPLLSILYVDSVMMSFLSFLTSIILLSCFLFPDQSPQSFINFIDLFKGLFSSSDFLFSGKTEEYGGIHSCVQVALYDKGEGILQLQLKSQVK